MLAIVIPYFKVTFFEETINSLAGQTNKNFKVYIGDDASPECPKKILKEFESKLNFKYQKFENNLGSISLVQQWNRCIDLIEDEEWIMILGDDDFLEETVVENWYKNY
jgi:glycosyltransferase involved in cell wall biosynthesis